MADFITTWANAIADFEGFTSGKSQLAVNNHNPGNLKYAGQPGAIGQDAQGFAIFPDDATGFQALYNQLNRFVQEFPDFSILQMMAHYLGQPSPTSDSQGDAYTYAASVAAYLGVDPSTTLSQLASGNIGSTTTSDQLDPALMLGLFGFLALWMVLEG